MVRNPLLTALLLASLTAVGLRGQSLSGSLQAMERQHAAALQAQIPFHADVASVYRAIVDGELVRVQTTANYRLHAVSFPYARPESLMLLEYLAAGYHRSCGEPLVVTSLTRPRSEQPRNASRLSVHPAGLAIDLRRSVRRSCRQWLERELLDLEERGLVEATREHWPSHYHVAAFPSAVRSQWPDGVVAAAKSTPIRSTTYQVHAGDTLWEIARNLGSSTSLIRAASGLASARIYPGQVLQVPLTDAPGRTADTGS